MSDATPATDAPQYPPMRFRRTRIGVSVFFGLLTVALCVLWVRSYWIFDTVVWNSDTIAFAISADTGKLGVEVIDGGALLSPGWGRHSYWLSESDSDFDDEPKTLLDFGWQSDDVSIFAYVPFWFLVLLCGAVARLGFVHRFSVRTMLIATTLVAVLLGLVVWLAR